MSKHTLAFLLPVLLVLLAGCRSEVTAQPTPTRYWTAREAYEKIRPAMLAWHEDAIVVYIGSLPTEQPEWRIRADGKAAWWSFAIQSPSVLRDTGITLLNEQVIVGVDRIPNKEFSIPSVAETLPLDEMIDSDEAVEIALESGANASSLLLRMKIERSDRDRYIPPAWGLTYDHLYDLSQQRRVIIDAVTGEVLRNDFAE